MKKFATLILTLALGCLASSAVQADNSDTIKIGYFNWSDALFTTNVVNYILEEKMGRDTKLTMAAPAAIYQGIAVGDIDFHVDAWLPTTHGDYYKKVARKTLDAGAIYTRAKEGWAVPAYVPKDKLNSIEDLKSAEVKQKLGGRITGIDPGAGLMRLSKQAMKAYALADYGYQLQQSSGPAMAAALKRAIANHEWIVVTAWNPHWMWSAFDLRYLKDPKGIMKGMQRADIMARHGFYQDEPDIYEMLDRILIPIDAVQDGMRRAEETSYADAAAEYVESHPKLVHYWVSGEMSEDE